MLKSMNKGLSKSYIPNNYNHSEESKIKGKAIKIGLSKI